MDKRTKYDHKVTEGFPGQKMLVLSPDQLLKMEQNTLAGSFIPYRGGLLSKCFLPRTG